MAKPKDLGSGSFIRHNGELCQIMEIQHRTPGNLRAFYQAKMRNVKTGKQTEYRYNADEDVILVRVETRELQYLYEEGDSFVCMDNDSYDQLPINKQAFGEGAKFMKEGDTITASFEGDLVIGAQAPAHVTLEITYTEPGVRGDTATNTLKPATVETGATVMVPLFCDTGDKIRIDTRSGEYMERVKG
jgi:elongation factor P